MVQETAKVSGVLESGVPRCLRVLVWVTVKPLSNVETLVYGRLHAEDDFHM